MMVEQVTKKESNKLFLPVQTLQGYGCVNCIWKTYGQCPKGLTGTKKVKEGYCKELADFILSLAEHGDSISAVKEKFFLYTQEMQAMADSGEYHRIHNELLEFKANRDTHLTNMGKEGYKQKKGELESSMLAYKLWWARLTDSVVKGVGRIADRESRKKEVQGATKVNFQQFNILLKQSDDKIKEIE